jgi:hypothetical protein
MVFQHVDIEGGIRRLSDRRIEDAIALGKFDRIDGMGKPLALEDVPADEHGRLVWWALRIHNLDDLLATPTDLNDVDVVC